ncbi:GlxA family transcriptional regulator [Pseudonocardia dioxanivorans]|uniref:GlxA family transcriptional regulator n=1 Tax=Pseudonocardia dioxanivorans TaxID=240495 RepID=UPI000CD0904A|nr:DJ-1/PfpI family protein [Pseudonocardia dioxanivorans]
MPAHRIVVPLFDGIQPLDVTGPYEVFMGATEWLRVRDRAPGYRVVLVGADGAPVRAESGMRLLADEQLPAPGRVDTLLVPGGRGARTTPADDSLVTWIRAAAPRAERVLSVCTGAFLLARAGLLAGHTVTTHWRYARALAAVDPAVEVHADAIHLRSGRVWTSAGVTAGIDLALAVVEADHGPDVAQAVAREMVVFLRRPGGQSQFAGPVWTAPAGRPTIRAAQDLIHGDPTADLRVPTLARRVGMSERHFSREFTREHGSPPGGYVEQVRVEAARGFLETGSAPVAAVAARAGFGSAESMRKAFLRRVGVAPDHYRRRFTTVR